MSDPTVYRCTPRSARDMVVDCMFAGLVPFLQSSPGMGKSSIMASIAHEMNLELIDHRMSTSVPEDMSGLPHFTDLIGESGKIIGTKAEFISFTDIFPIQGMPLVPGREGWMVFLDELNSAEEAVQKSAYKLILDRMTGQKKLHERVILTAAGNLNSDRAFTNKLSTAMQSRMVHLEMEISFDEWLEDVALKQNYDWRIIAYLSQYPSKLMDFDAKHQEKTFACPRTWEFMNRLIRDKKVEDKKMPLYAGTLTSGIALEFLQYTKVYANIPKITEVLADPKGVHVPHDNPSKWGVVSMLMEHVKDDTFSLIVDYIARFDTSFQLVFYRSVMVRNPSMRQHPAFGPGARLITNYLNSK